MIKKNTFVGLVVLILILFLSFFIKCQQNNPEDALKQISIKDNVQMIKDNNKAFDLYITKVHSHKYLAVAFLEKNIFGKWKLVEQSKAEFKDKNTGFWSVYNNFSDDKFIAIGIIDPNVGQVVFNKEEAKIYDIPDSKYRVFVYKYSKDELTDDFGPRYIAK